MIPAKDLFYGIVDNGIKVDIFQAEESLFLIKLFLKNSNEIDKSSFTILFRTLQYVFTKELTLAITKLYEEEKKDKRYKIRSIPYALKLLEESANELIIEQKPSFIKKLVKCGFNEDYLNRLDDAQITNETVKYFHDNLPPFVLKDFKNMSKSLNALKTARNKVIAHSEAILTSDLPRTTWDEIEQLIDYAKEFLGIVGIGYLSIAYEDDNGNHFLSSDAKRTTRAMERLLQKAGILSEDGSSPLML